jgi:hypothetical protein
VTEVEKEVEEVVVLADVKERRQRGCIMEDSEGEDDEVDDW